MYKEMVPNNNLIRLPKRAEIEAKQIEEIAKTMCKNYGGCSQCMFFSSCDVKSFALRLQEADYRKQQKAEWNLRKNYDAGSLLISCSLCNYTKRLPMTSSHSDDQALFRDFVEEHQFCPNCGAQMKGGTQK